MDKRKEIKGFDDVLEVRVQLLKLTVKEKELELDEATGRLKEAKYLLKLSRGEPTKKKDRNV